MTINRIFRKTILAVAIVGAVHAIPIANAQSGGVLEEIIVTAQKREQSAQDVGISITTFTGEQVDRMALTRAPTSPC